MKPTPNILSTQKNINTELEEIDINIKGRHDPIIVPRAVVVMECMTALTILDALMLNMSSKLTSIEDFYKK